MNIVLVNLLAFVILSLLFGYVDSVREKLQVSSATIFIMSLLSVVCGNNEAELNSLSRYLCHITLEWRLRVFL